MLALDRTNIQKTVVYLETSSTVTHKANETFMSAGGLVSNAMVTMSKNNKVVFYFF